MTTPYEIPLTPDPQTFLISLAGEEYRMTVRWNAQAQLWSMDLGFDGDDPLVQGAPLVAGLDLLAQYRFLGIGGSLVVQTDFAPELPPTEDNLGTQGRLYFVTEP